MNNKRYKLYQGDNMESLKKLPDNSIDSIVTDPPYGLSFMGKKWDYDVPSVDFWKEVYRVLKPGGHIVSFGGTRTYHRMVVNIEDAGFEIRDQIMWIYSTGFPKSLNIGKAVDKMEGNEREVVGDNPNHRKTTGLLELGFQDGKESSVITKGNSDWEGWGTALKPANEPICLARKPLSEKSVAENVLKWKTGGLNIDGCRIGYQSEEDKESAKPGSLNATGENSMFGLKSGNKQNEEGRFPANLIFECCCDEVIKGETGEPRIGRVGAFVFQPGIFEGAGWKKDITGKWYNDTGDIHTNPDCPCYQLDKQSGVSKSTPSPSHIRKGNVVADERTSKAAGLYGDGSLIYGSNHNDKGGASRFFYQAKVSKAERNMGLDGFEEKIIEGRDQGQDERSVAYKPRPVAQKNTHPTVKPVSLMTYLCRLITPENGIVLDPFMGSGSTGIAAQLEGFRFVGMEMDEEYIKIAESRIENWEKYIKFVK